MSGLIRFAGYDPDEEDFDGIEPAPLHAADLQKPRRVINTSIDLARARHLRALGRSWDEVGRQLAVEAGRTVAYRGGSIWSAVAYGIETSSPVRGEFAN